MKHSKELKRLAKGNSARMPHEGKLFEDFLKKKFETMKKDAERSSQLRSERIDSKIRKSDLEAIPEIMSWIFSVTEVYLDDFVVLQPWLITVFAALLRKRIGPKIVMGLGNPSRFANAIGLGPYCGFVQNCSYAEHGRTVKLSQIKKGSNYEQKAYEISKLLLESIKEDELQYTDAIDLRDTIYYVLNELMRNVIQHSDDPDGGLLIAQKMRSGYFGDSKPCIQITVVDNGIGILKSLQTYHKIDSADIALLNSIKPHFSGAFPEEQIGGTDVNAGLGLFMISEIAKDLGGFMAICSSGKLLSIKGNDDENNDAEMKDACFDGTFVIFEIPINCTLADYKDMLKQIYAKAEERMQKKNRRISVICFDEQRMNDCKEFVVKMCAENVSQAKKSVDDFLLPILRNKQNLCLNFIGVPIATQSFAHSLLKRLIIEARTQKCTIFIKKANAKVKDAIEFVDGYV